MGFFFPASTHRRADQNATVWSGIVSEGAPCHQESRWWPASPGSSLVRLGTGACALVFPAPRPDQVPSPGLVALAAILRQGAALVGEVALLGGAGRESRVAALQNEHAELERELNAVSAHLKAKKQSQETRAAVSGRPHPSMSEAVVLLHGCVA